jgi:nucleoside 2-deoxyribosyltransferase
MYILTTYVPDRHILSGALRERNEKGFDVVVDSFDTLRTFVIPPRGPIERMDRILLYVLQKMETDDAGVLLSPTYDYSIAYSKTPTEFKFLIDRAIDMGYLELAYGEAEYRLTAKGWIYVTQLSRSEVKGHQAFVAMSFAPELVSAFIEGIKPAVEHTGYIPLRVDQVQHNQKIDDQIVADIRKSGLLIADMTGHKPGVYFEAGLALGLGIPVIWTCRETDIQAAHFDTRQYNHIVWTNPQDLRQKLIARIEATVPIRVLSKAAGS